MRDGRLKTRPAGLPPYGTHMRVTSATHLEASSRFTHQLHLNKSGGGTWKEAESHLTLRVHDNRHVILMTRQTAACVLSDDV